MNVKVMEMRQRCCVAQSRNCQKYSLMNNAILIDSELPFIFQYKIQNDYQKTIDARLVYFRSKTPPS